MHGGIHITAAAPSGNRIPWQLPPSVPLTNRAVELAAMDQARAQAEQRGGPTLIVLSGLGGVGKTVLATSWLHGSRDRCADGQLHVDLGAQGQDGPVLPGEALSRFLRALGLPPDRIPPTVEERAATFRSLTAGRGLAVLLDDAMTAAQVRPLLPSSPGIAVVTSRKRLPGLSVDGFTTVHLEPMDQQDAVDLLASTLDDNRVDQQPADARALVDLCDGLPLAVRVAGARLAARPQRPINAMVRAMAREQDRLNVLAIDGDHTVRAALDLSYQELPAPAAALYRWLGLFPGVEFGGSLAAAAAEPGEGAPDSAELLDLLVEANLLTESRAERYRFHDLVRLHAASLAEQDPPEASGAALRRILDHQLSGVFRAEEILDPHHRSLPRELGPQPVAGPDLGQDDRSALDWLEAERTSLMASVRRARTAGLPSVAWQLVDAMWPLFVRRKYYEDSRAAHAEGLAAARSCGDRAAEARMLTSGGLGELGSGEHARALEMFDRAARLLRQIGDELGVARTWNYRGLAHQRLGRLAEATGAFRQAAADCAALGDRRAGALARLNLADVSLALKHFDEAAAAAAGARGVLLDEGDPYNAARATVLLGEAQLGSGAPGPAEAHLLDAVGHLRRVSANRELARALLALGQAAEQLGLPPLARERYREAAQLYGSLPGRLGQPPDSLRAGIERVGEPS
ncbi:NB-ARC domain-containing protein [Streptacidiphilus sp. P02-A3a]|uniref:NB-ARC domain-containing protein n=1 Tax=Streptacidiphilus sp. P02-A3a TaxID=2704468 RepID=UPI0015FB4196|nr:NB-ARC domain-containing protein [Streptacidiphilus sp. P02-A3a]QMU71281.1 regulator [Streptacidiphilus sp. P02-A3a]